MEKFFAGLAIIVVLLIAVFTIYVSTIDGDNIVGMLEDQLGSGNSVEIDHASVSLLSRSVENGSHHHKTYPERSSAFPCLRL